MECSLHSVARLKSKSQHVEPLHLQLLNLGLLLKKKLTIKAVTVAIPVLCIYIGK